MHFSRVDVEPDLVEFRGCLEEDSPRIIGRLGHDDLVVRVAQISPASRRVLACRQHELVVLTKVEVGEHARAIPDVVLRYPNRLAAITLEVVLSIKVEWGRLLVREGVVGQGALAAQAIAGVPVTTRQVAKRWSRVWR